MTLGYGAALELWGEDPFEPLETYSTDAIYPRPGDAQGACSQLAMTAGVLSKIEAVAHQPKNPNVTSTKRPSLGDGPVSVQSFNDELPRPDLGLQDGLFGNKPPSGYMHTLVMNARGGGIQVKDYYWTREVKGITCMFSCLFEVTFLLIVL